jgi:SRSO17 transposase
MAEYLGERTPYSIQQFIYRGRYSANGLRDELRDYVKDELSEEDGVLVPDETGFLKQGRKSCGVMRQYSGTAGRIENCQIGVFMTYASSKGHTVIDRRLYIPKEWHEDKKRCKEAGIPETVKFQTKPEMALEMIQEATVAGVPYRWVTGDCVYGDYTDIRVYLEEHKKCYVMNVSGKAYVWRGYKQSSVGSILKNLPNDGWFEASCGNGSKGERLYDWLALPVNPGTTEDFARSLLIRRSKTFPEELRAYICFAPVDTPNQKLVETAGVRWSVETSFKESKSQVGLDQYEVRSYDGWHRHITFACIALAFLTVLSCRSFDTRAFQQHNPASSSLDDFKKGRKLRV